MSVMRIGRSDICARRGFHRCRAVENPRHDREIAVCIECFEHGTAEWAAENLLAEYRVEHTLP